MNVRPRVFLCGHRGVILGHRPGDNHGCARPVLGTVAVVTAHRVPDARTRRPGQPRGPDISLVRKMRRVQSGGGAERRVCPVLLTGGGEDSPATRGERKGPRGAGGTGRCGLAAAQGSARPRIPARPSPGPSLHVTLSHRKVPADWTGWRVPEPVRQRPEATGPPTKAPRPSTPSSLCGFRSSCKQGTRREGPYSPPTTGPVSPRKTAASPGRPGAPGPAVRGRGRLLCGKQGPPRGRGQNWDKQQPARDERSPGQHERNPSVPCVCTRVCLHMHVCCVHTHVPWMGKGLKQCVSLPQSHVRGWPGVQGRCPTSIPHALS